MPIEPHMALDLFIHVETSSGFYCPVYEHTALYFICTLFFPDHKLLRSTGNNTCHSVIFCGETHLLNQAFHLERPFSNNN